MSLSGGVVLGIGAMCSWETAASLAVYNHPDAHAGSFGVLTSAIASD
jgi:hypothetical protein